MGSWESRGRRSRREECSMAFVNLDFRPKNKHCSQNKARLSLRLPIYDGTTDLSRVDIRGRAGGGFGLASGRVVRRACLRRFRPTGCFVGFVDTFARWPKERPALARKPPRRRELVRRGPRRNRSKPRSVPSVPRRSSCSPRRVTLLRLRRSLISWC